MSLLVAGVSPAQADSVLSGLSIIESQITKGRAPKTGYTRAQFGQTWADVDRNGCDTRNDILKRDLTAEVFKERTRECVVLSGTLIDPFSGEIINFVRGNVSSMEVQIDHVVALSNAWQTGAFKLSIKDRTAFANDPLNLLAVKGRLNSQKRDGDAATWLPPLKSYRCDYVSRQIAVKIRYKLWFTAPEKEAMIRILKSCPEKPLPTS
uniref:HNH endonuclease family protein n=1 Tax=Candidatus Planktophila sp. TaxID=2175601 RepID=UPI0040495B4B